MGCWRRGVRRMWAGSQGRIGGVMAGTKLVLRLLGLMS
jgi:hypothetical protein